MWRTRTWDCLHHVFLPHILMLKPDMSSTRSLVSLYKNNVVPKIGLEVHAQLKINSKLFSHGGNNYLSTPNSQLDLFDVALPGTLPKLNSVALEKAILTGVGLNCNIQERIHFDRKNYFYNDMPAGFQLTQYSKPVAKHGFIDFIVTAYQRSKSTHSKHYDLFKYLYFADRLRNADFKPYRKRSQIKQIQLEQDSAKTLNHEDMSLVDYNRSGAALVEIVFEPDLLNHHEASSLVRELILILKALDVSTCELQEGTLRVDANVSISRIQDRNLENSAKVELKNLNSLKALNKGINAEIERQTALLLRGEEVAQESRSFNSRSSETEPLRMKENTVDYRYVFEPSIPPLRLDDDLVGRLQNLCKKTKMPCQVSSKLANKYNLNLVLLNDLIDEPQLDEYFENTMIGKNYDPNVVADFLIYTVYNLRYSDNIELLRNGFHEQTMQTILDMVLEERINFAQAYELIRRIMTSDDVSCPRKIVDDLGLLLIKDSTSIAQLCDDALPKMKSMSRSYAKKGEKNRLRLMLEKLNELTNNRISIEKAAEYIDKKLRPEG